MCSFNIVRAKTVTPSPTLPPPPHSSSPFSYSSSPSRQSLERYDRVTAMKVMQLRSQETVSGRKEFIVVGATSVTGEDAQCKGKVRQGIVAVCSLI